MSNNKQTNLGEIELAYHRAIAEVANAAGNRILQELKLNSSGVIIEVAEAK
jgi:hypothetical protein